MNNDENFEFNQYPDFAGPLEPFDDALFDLDDSDDDLIIDCPFIPLRDLVLYPRMVMPLFVGRDRSLAAVQAAASNDENLIVAAQRDSDLADPTVDDIYAIGTEISIARALRMPDNSTSVLAQGRRRVEIIEFTSRVRSTSKVT